MLNTIVKTTKRSVMNNVLSISDLLKNVTQLNNIALDKLFLIINDMI